MKMLIGLGLVVWLVGSGVVWGYTTFDEAWKAAGLKESSQDYVGARMIYTDIYNNIAKSTHEKIKAQFNLAFTYVSEGNNLQARIEFKKIIDYPVFETYYVGKAMIAIGQLNIAEKIPNIQDFVNVIIDLRIFDEVKMDAFKNLILIKPDWSTVVTAIGTPTDWSGYYYRAKAKQQLKDYAGAKADLLSAQNLCGDNNDAFKKCGELLERINLQIKQAANP